MEEEIIGGKHSVIEALKSGRTINKIWVAENAQKHLTQPIVVEAKKLGVVIQHVDKRKLDQLAPGVQHQGVVAQAAPYAYAEVEDILQAAEQKGEPPFILLLDEIEDPHNLGSILRTADCTGVHGVIVPKRRSAQVTATVSKTSAGAAEYVLGSQSHQPGANDRFFEGKRDLGRRYRCVGRCGDLRNECFRRARSHRHRQRRQRHGAADPGKMRRSGQAADERADQLAERLRGRRRGHVRSIAAPHPRLDRDGGFAGRAPGGRLQYDRCLAVSCEAVANQHAGGARQSAKQTGRLPGFYLAGR